MKAYVNRKRGGELALVRRKIIKKGKRHKFLPKFVGPSQIVKRVGPVTHLVEDIPGQRTWRRNRRFNAHVGQLKRFRLREMQQEVVVEEPVPEAHLVEELDLIRWCGATWVAERIIGWCLWTRNGSYNDASVPEERSGETHIPLDSDRRMTRVVRIDAPLAKRLGPTLEVVRVWRLWVFLTSLRLCYKNNNQIIK